MTEDLAASKKQHKHYSTKQMAALIFCHLSYLPCPILTTIAILLPAASFPSKCCLLYEKIKESLPCNCLPSLTQMSSFDEILWFQPDNWLLLGSNLKCPDAITIALMSMNRNHIVWMKHEKYQFIIRHRSTNQSTTSISNIESYGTHTQVEV